MNEKSKWQEREDAIVRSIMSGNNACGTLKTALEKGRLEGFLRMMIQPTLQVCASEDDQLRRQMLDASRDAETKRFALESVIANVPELPAPVKDAMRPALPGHPFLN